MSDISIFDDQCNGRPDDGRLAGSFCDSHCGSLFGRGGPRLEPGFVDGGCAEHRCRGYGFDVGDFCSYIVGEVRCFLCEVPGSGYGWATCGWQWCGDFCVLWPWGGHDGDFVYSVGAIGLHFVGVAGFYRGGWPWGGPVLSSSAARRCARCSGRAGSEGFHISSSQLGRPAS